MIAGYDNQCPFEIDRCQQPLEELVQIRQQRQCFSHVVVMAYHVGRPVIKEYQVVRRRKSSQHLPGMERRPLRHVAVPHAIAPAGIGQVDAERVLDPQIVGGAQPDASRLHRVGNGAMQPLAAVDGVKIALGIGVGEGH